MHACVCGAQHAAVTIRAQLNIKVCMHARMHNEAQMMHARMHNEARMMHARMHNRA